MDANAWAHPRSRGENPLPPAPERALNGSSPLTRGKHGPVDDWWASTRLIPAHAGKTELIGGSDERVQAHPRSRGENVGEAVGYLFGGGSSPLTRGKLVDTSRESVSIGLIPAHAGKTHFGDSGLYPIRAHPRSRGENGREGEPRHCASGSSPLTRGKLRAWVPFPVG